MKKYFVLVFIITAALGWSGCKKTNYPGGVVSAYLPMFDLRNLYKGTDVALTTDAMFGSSKITGIVISDFTGGNMPAGLLVIQDHRRLNTYRGISLAIGADAAKYAPGDSVTVDVEGGTLTRANGIMQITGVPATKVNKISSGNAVVSTRYPSSTILADPSQYESTMVAIVKGGFDPIPTPVDKFGGEKLVNDGFDNLTLHTEAAATFAGISLPVRANFYGILLNSTSQKGDLVPQLRMRSGKDYQILSSTVEITPVVISGFASDLSGADANNEYVQLLATRDIDFAVTPFSVVVTNNAGASVPAGVPANGWATGGGSAAVGTTPATMFRTFKFNLTEGTAKKGTYFYVGGSNKRINGDNSTVISSANWIRAFDYGKQDGDGFGARNGGIFANSGNAFGMAVFAGIEVNKDTQPIDVIFVSTGGLLFSAGPPAAGYRIANTDLYDVINPITLASQPFYRQGSNTLAMSYPPGEGYFYKLGGIYNPRLGRWVKARTQQTIAMTKSSLLSEIEAEFPVGTPDNPGILPTAIKD